MRIDLVTAAIALTFIVPSAASAQETLSYRYDSQGRLTQAGTTNASRSTTIQYDKANNRTSLSMTNSMAPMSASAMPMTTSSARTSSLVSTDASPAADKALRDAALAVSPYYKR